MNTIAKADAGKVIGRQYYTVFDKFGRLKRQFQDNALNRAVFRFFRAIAAKLGIALVDETGAPRQGLFVSLALYGLRIPGLTGQWANTKLVENLVTSAGKAGVASRINGAGSEAAFTYLAVGTGTTAAAAGDTTLQTEITDSGLARASATVSRVTTTVTNDTARLDETFSVTGTKAVTEAGALNAASSGVLLGRQVFSAVNVANGDTLQVTYDFQAS